MIVGISLLTMFLLGIFTLMGLDSRVIVSGDPLATQENILNFRSTFILGVAGYFIILILDVIVSIGIYTILKTTNKTLALITSASRLIYTAIALISVMALCYYYSEFYIKGLLIAYIFFILHLLTLGILTLKSMYIPKILGILLVAAAPFYTLMTYGYLVLADDLSNLLNSIVMIPSILAEVALAFWLIIKSKRITELVKHQ